MEWLFDRRGKSVASSAKRVVADMHSELEKQKLQIKQLEKTVFAFKNLCTESLLRDVERLEGRKKELIAELAETDEQILVANERLRLAREEVAQLLQQASLSQTNSANKKLNLRRTSSLEEQYMEETEMWRELQQALKEPLFMVHMNTSTDIIVYQPDGDGHDLVLATKIPDIKRPNKTVALTHYERLMAYGIKVVSNRERDFPDISEIPIPLHLSQPSREAMKSEHLSSTRSNNNNNNNSNNSNSNLGTLVGAFEIAVLPGIVIDLWKENVAPFRRWVTTPIDGIGFVALERVFLELGANSGRTKSMNSDVGVGYNLNSKRDDNNNNNNNNKGNEEDDDTATPFQADLFGRHPSKGLLLRERIKCEEE